MANNDNFSVPSTQGCSGQQPNGPQQDDNYVDTSVSKKNPNNVPNGNSESSDDDIQNPLPSKIDTWKEVEENRRFDVSVADGSVPPTYGCNPQK